MKRNITQILSHSAIIPYNFIILNVFLISSSVSIQCGPHLMWGIFPLQIIKSGFFPEFDNFFIVWCGATMVPHKYHREKIETYHSSRCIKTEYTKLLLLLRQCQRATFLRAPLLLLKMLNTYVVEVNQAVICYKSQRGL